MTKPALTAHDSNRRRVLEQLQEWVRVPMLVLSFVWLALVIAEFVWGAKHLLEVLSTFIWVIFIVEFTVRFILAPRKPAFLRSNWLSAVALLVPALRMARITSVLRFAGGLKGLTLVGIVGTANRTMNALRASLKRRGLGYVLVLTILVALLGAAGMLAFEPAAQVPGGFANYGEALWWTGMLLTSIGSEFWPKTAEGRLLCFLLALYGFTVFGYITASFASFFVDRDAAAPETDVVGAKDLRSLRAEIAGLRADLAGRSSAPRAG